jgi:predicted unusual protein kinase regulating ubiquinone biosynthesis (AarF/ABC1/UbiB family)
MGGVLIKVGQFLSARLDVLPRTITDELTGLQDEVGPEEFETIRGEIEREFNQPANAVFASFQENPLASASIGQVHQATLVKPASLAPAKVVVKVQRPKIEQIVATDLAAIRVVGRWVNYYPPVRRRANVPELIEEFCHTLYEEIDYLHEGKNAERFAENFSDRADVRVPAVYWSHTTRRVLTLEDVLAIKITDYTAIEAAGISRSEVASRLFDAYMKQIFEDRFFHADPHPGNLFVLPQPAGAEGPGWRLVFVDFGMAGEVTPAIFNGLREALLAVGTRDSARLIEAYQILGILLPGADLQLLRRATSAMFERFWGMSTQEMMKMSHREAVAIIQEFEELVYDMPFQLPENMILLGRCLSILNGICTGLDPEFNVWTHIVPYAERMIRSEAGSQWKFVVNEALDILRITFSLPRRTDSLIQHLEQGRLEVRTPDIKTHLTRLEHAQSRLTASIVFAAALIAAVQLYLADDLIFAAVLGFLALVSLLYTLFRR